MNRLRELIAQANRNDPAWQPHESWLATYCEEIADLIDAAEALIMDCEKKYGDPHTLRQARLALTKLEAK